jgi:hypothetical protein
MYAIKIIDATRGEVALDLTTGSFPYTFEANDIAELNDRSASWSYTIRLPRTANNEDIFGHAGTPFVDTDKPYKRFLCNVYTNGLLIIERGVLFLDSATKTEYDVQILSGVANVFELMKDIDYKLQANNHITRLPFRSAPSGAHTAAYAYAYSLNEVVSDSGGIKTTTTKDGVYKYAFPLLRVGSTYPGVLNSLLSKIGYSLVTNTPDSVLNGLYLSMASREAGTEQPIIWQSAVGNVPLNVLTPLSITNEYPSADAPLYLHFEVQSSGYYYGELTPRSVMSSWFNAGGALHFYWKVAGGSWQSKIYNNTNFNADGGKVPVVLDIELENTTAATAVETYISLTDVRFPVVIHGNVQWVESLPWSNDGSTSGYRRAQLIVNSPDTSVVQPNQNIWLEKNTGIANAQDLFKILCQVFGWTIVTDPVSKTIEARTFAYINANRANAKDWTDKMVMESDIQTQYEFGSYAQSNIIELAENKVTGYIDRATFAIPNDRLATEKTMASIKVSSGKDNKVEQWKQEVSDEGDVSYKWNNTTTHLLTYEGTTLTHYTADNIKANYADLISTMEKVVVITAEFLLSAIDIKNFSPFVPVYLRQYGRYFYVNKIQDWEDGKVCKVELVQLRN